MTPAEYPHSIAAEQMILGSLLLDPDTYNQIAGVIAIDDFHAPRHQLVFDAITGLVEDGKPHDLVSVSQWMDAEVLERVGGLAFLRQLRDETPSTAGILKYAEEVCEYSRQRKLLHVGDLIERAVRNRSSAADVITWLRENLKSIESGPGGPVVGAGIVLRHVADIVAEAREPLWLEGLCDILERNVIAVLAGVRNTLKSFIALHWAMLAAVNGHAVLILTAEGGGLDRRVAAWMKTYAPAVDLASLRIVALERALNLNLLETFRDLDDAMRPFDFKPDLTVVDTFSKYSPGLDENDNAAVALYLATLSEQLRHRYTCTVLLVAHAGHGDARRPRGASTLMANPDAEFIVERPDPTGLGVTVTRERFKDSPALGALSYMAEIVDLGRLDRRGRAVTSLVIRDSDEPAPASGPKHAELRGKAQRQLLAALRAHKADGHLGVWTIGDLRELGRKAGMSKGTARSAAEILSLSPYLVPSVGGWRLKDE